MEKDREREGERERESEKERETEKEKEKEREREKERDRKRDKYDSVYEKDEDIKKIMSAVGEQCRLRRKCGRR